MIGFSMEHIKVTSSLRLPQKSSVSRLLDVVVFPVFGYRPAVHVAGKRGDPVSARVPLAPDLWIGRLPRDLGRSVIQACLPTGFHHRSPSAVGELYSFVLERPSVDTSVDWDVAQRLQLAVALSRLVRETPVSLRYSARVDLDSDGGLIRIVPTEIIGSAAESFSPMGIDAWLTPEDVETLQKLIHCLTTRPLPKRLLRALWTHESAVRSYESPIRWLLVTIALEAIVCTKDRGVTSQFAQRVPRLARLVGDRTITAKQARRAYSLRSKIAHGVRLVDLGQTRRALLDAMERLIRTTLSRAIMDREVAAFLGSRRRVADTWKLKKRKSKKCRHKCGVHP